METFLPQEPPNLGGMPTVAAPTSPQAVIRLNNGLNLPAIGLGVYLSTPGATTKDAVLSALRLGYRYIDTAQFYKNEKDVGDAVRESGIPREDIWITSKVLMGLSMLPWHGLISWPDSSSWPLAPNILWNS